MIRVRSNLRAFERSLSDLARRQVPLTIARALTDVAKRDIAEAEAGRLARVLDRPTPFTRRGVRVEAARKARLRARVAVKDIQGGYLARLEEGVSDARRGRRFSSRSAPA